MTDRRLDALEMGRWYWRCIQDFSGIRYGTVILRGLTQGGKAIVEIERDSHTAMEICPIEEIGRPVMENEDV